VARVLRRLAWSLVALLLAGGAAVALARLADQPIETVTVSGRLTHLQPAQIEHIVRAHLAGVGLASVNLADIDQALAALPWVDAVTVRRRWPRGLAIHIVEQIAVASWDGTGLLNTRGEQFLRGTSAIAGLPALAGPEGSEQEVTERFLTMQGQLAPRGLTLTSVTLDARGAWQFALSNGVLVRLGASHVDERFGRFVAAAASLVEQRSADIGYVDMRYGNGFAVGWKSGVAGSVIPGSTNKGEHSHFDG
jgi:cell division protein FtsQ